MFVWLQPRRGVAVLRAVIVDDEAAAVESLRLLLERYCGDIVRVEAWATSAAEARELLERLHPDLLFLDVEMPGENGFELLRSLPRRDFAVIFVTAFERYALQALRSSAVDYLLKPVDPVELRQAVEKAVQQRWTQAERLNVLLSNLGQRTLQRLVVPLREGYRIVALEEVLYCQSEGSYTRVVTPTQRLLTTRLLGEWEELLEPYGFVRIHRAFLVNLERVQLVRRGEPQGGGVVVLDTGHELPVARRRYSYLLERLQQG